MGVASTSRASGLWCCRHPGIPCRSLDLRCGKGGLLLKNHLFSSEQLQDEVFKEETSRCSGVERRGEVHRDLLPLPLSVMLTEAEAVPSSAGKRRIGPRGDGEESVSCSWVVSVSLESSSSVRRAPTRQQSGSTKSEQLEEYRTEEPPRNKTQSPRSRMQRNK